LPDRGFGNKQDHTQTGSGRQENSYQPIPMTTMRNKKINIELLFLGSGNAFAPGRAYGSFLVDDRILFEATPTTLPALRELNIPLKDIEYLFISHFHGDHCFGLPFIFLDHYFVTKRKKPLTIIGPKGLKKLSYTLIDLAFPDTRKRYSRNFPVKILEVSPGKEYSLKTMTFKVFKMSHGKNYNLGFSLAYKKKRLAYSGDTGLGPSLLELLQGANIAVLEMTSLDGDYPFHLNQENILEIRKQLPPETRLILTHLPALTGKQEKALKQNPYGVLLPAEDRQRYKFEL
jgi:ribonuclease Z